jgi:Mg-chelatase subunit ChlD
MGRFAPAVLLSLLGCSGGDDDSSTGPGGGSGGADNPGIGISFGNGSSVGPQTPSGQGADECGDPEFRECAGSSYEGESLPLDIYLMFDQSGSMLNDVGGMTRMQAVQGATTEFLRAPESARIGVGIGYFGHQPLGQTSCEKADYREAAVGVTQDHEDVIASLAGREPTGETPTGAALRGACDYATGWKRQTLGHDVVILLVTDGVPEAPVSCTGGACCPSLDDAVQAATECSKSGVRTFVLGVGPALGNLAKIADAGGTGDAYLVEDRNAAADVLAALNQIRFAASIPCELSIPKPAGGASLDFSRVNLSLSPSGGCDFSPVYYVADPADCGADGGWSYDKASSPSSVNLCPATCARVTEPNARLRFSIGCETAVAPIF